jgi:hypothetical protein
MSGSVTGTTRSGPNAAPTPAVPGLIDCDLHNTVDSDQVLDPTCPSSGANTCAPSATAVISEPPTHRWATAPTSGPRTGISHPTRRPPSASTSIPTPSRTRS